MTLLVAGIDGGQSSTVALIADENGRILSRGTAGPADEVGAGPGSTRLRDALRAALTDACRSARLPYESGFAAIVAGVSGYEGRIFGAPAELSTPRLLITHDAPIAHAGALGGQPGAIVIAGTGSVVYAVDERGRSKTIGGWGYLFGDEGSAFGIVRDGLARLMRSHDDENAEHQEAARQACAFFGVDSLRTLARKFYASEIGRDKLASFAAQAVELAPFCDSADDGARRLADLVLGATATIPAPKIALLGGVFNNARFRARVRDEIVRRVAGASIVDPKYEPAAGALLLAYRELELPVKELTQ